MVVVEVNLSHDIQMSQRERMIIVASTKRPHRLMKGWKAPTSAASGSSFVEVAHTAQPR